MATDGARALRAFETETIVARLRDLEFYDSNRITCWWMIAANPNVTLDVVKALPEKPWLSVSGALERNAGFSGADVREFTEWRRAHPNASACACGTCGAMRTIRFSGKKDFTFADLERMAADEGCTVSVASSSYRFYLARNLFCSDNPNMTWQLYERYFRDDSECLGNPAVANARAIRENPAFPWHARGKADRLFRNPAIGAEALAELERLHPGLPFWDWGSYSWSDAVTWEIVVRHWDKPWCMRGLSRNPKVVDWRRLSEWPHGLGKEGEAELAEARRWCWKRLSENPAVATWARVCERPELPWCAEGLANNPAVCVWEAIAAPPPGQPRAGPSCWDPAQCCFVWSKVQFVGAHEREAWARRWLAARRIQRAWCAAYYTPGTPVWRRRMAREVAELQGLGAGGAAAAAS